MLPGRFCVPRAELALAERAARGGRAGKASGDGNRAFLSAESGACSVIFREASVICSLKIGKLGPVEQKHLSFPHSTLCDARAMPLRLSSLVNERRGVTRQSWALRHKTSEPSSTPAQSIQCGGRRGATRKRFVTSQVLKQRAYIVLHATPTMLQSFDPWLRQGSSWTSPPLDLWKLARWPVAMSVGVATCESSVVVLASCFRHGPTKGGRHARCQMPHASNLPSLWVDLWN
jgi:hypothetical protein